MRMAHGTLHEFDPTKESIEDFEERYGIHGDNADKKKASLVRLLGQDTFAKLKTLACSTTISELTLDATKNHLNNYF